MGGSPMTGVAGPSGCVRSTIVIRRRTDRRRERSVLS
jgi:hypothetical protein